MAVLVIIYFSGPVDAEGSAVITLTFKIVELNDTLEMMR